MKRRKFLVGSAVILGGTGLITGSQGFSRVDAERETRITVEDDESAYLSLHYESTSHGFDCKKENLAFVQLRNQTAEPLYSVDLEFREIPDTIEVKNGDTPLDSGDTLSVVDVHDADDAGALDVGEAEFVELTAECGEGKAASGNIEFDISFEGDDTSIDTDRPEVVAIECDCPEEDDKGDEGKDDGVDIGLSNINSPLKLSDNVDPSTVTVSANGQEFGTESKGNSENLEIDFDEPEDLGCGQPSNKIDVTVEGETNGGDSFSETIEDVNCSN